MLLKPQMNAHIKKRLLVLLTTTLMKPPLDFIALKMALLKNCYKFRYHSNIS